MKTNRIARIAALAALFSVTSTLTAEEAASPPMDQAQPQPAGTAEEIMSYNKPIKRMSEPGAARTKHEQSESMNNLIQRLAEAAMETPASSFKLRANAPEGRTYTSIGYGDLVLPEHWRILAPIQGLIGILMCGLSASVFFAVISQLHINYSAKSNLTR